MDRDFASSPGAADPSRRRFLRRAAGAGAGGLALAGLAAGGARAQDGGRGRSLPDLHRGRPARQFREIQADEDAHVAFLLDALGGLARPRPTFVDLNQPDLVTFAKVSGALENTGTGAYLGALPYISNPKIVSAAGSIAQIEARHSGYLDVLLDEINTTNVFGEVQRFERALTIDEVLALAGPFIESLNDPDGRFPLTFSTTDLGPANDVAILNFALALEYLEMAFYDLNVPRFFGP